MRTDSLLFILFLALMLGVFQNLAFDYYFYWKFWWYDVMMHFLGGAIVASSLAWAVMYEFSDTMRDWFFKLAYVIPFVFIVGMFWEVFEFTVKVDPELTHQQWIFDTLIDLAVDVAGGVSAYIVFRAVHAKHGN